ncbi:hypothetical protein QYE76_012033 [Lolium multiflorum]|uniref:CCHC-type domain-containing protein n=1 Tax=Lolium multiflorum TaxID=4521 RepID=A0AAD8TY34_LOLMU|nr:hypothetical protein QYE76_012033 [Lolium multiflorum]
MKLAVLVVVTVVVAMLNSELAVSLHNNMTMVWRGRVRESLEMTMQRFLHGLKYDIKGIVRHHSYTTMNELLHHAREAEAQLAEEAQIKGRATGAGRYTPRAPPSTAPAPSSRSAPYSTPSSKPVSNVSNTKKSESAASTSGSSMSTARNRDMNCHTCGGKGHFKRDCPNRKVMIINEDNEYETGDDVDPNAPEDDDYDSDGVDAFPSEARTIVVSQRALNVQPSASTQRCNLFQTKTLVGPDKACKVIIDGGSCRNLASKELCAKLKLKYLPHLHPYYIQWLSDNGEMKVNHMVRVEFAIGPVLQEFSDVFPEEVPAGLPPLRGIEHQIDLIPGASLPNRAPYRTNPEETKEIQKQESHAGGLMGHFGCEKTLLMLADHFYWPKMRRDMDKNPTKEIFSELDEINAQGLIFPRSFQKTGGDTKWGDEAPTPQGRAARVGPAPPYGVGPSCRPLRCPSAYLKPPSRNPITESHDTEILPETPPPPIPSRGFGDRLRHLPEGNHLYITMPASGLMRE